jgi:hypothetical protein
MTDTEIDDTTPCFEELQLAQACIDADAEACSCFDDSFMITFPQQVEEAFLTSIASNDPSSPNFCPQVGSSACEFLQTSASCCCHQKTTEYSACLYAKDLFLKSDVFQSTCSVEDVVSASCSIELEPDSQNNQMIIWGIIASVVLCILSVLCSCCCSRRRRRRRKGGKKGTKINVNVSSEGNVTKETTTDRHESSEYHHAQKRHQNRKPKAAVDESPSNYEESLSGLSRFNWDKFNESGSSKKQKEKKKKKEKKSDEEKERRRSRRRGSRRQHEEGDDEDDCSSSSERSKGRKGRRRKKQLILLEDDPREETKKKKSRSPEKTILAAENSMRQARTLMMECNQENGEEPPSGHLLSLMPQIRHLINLLEEDRNRLEKSVQNIKEEKLSLKNDLETFKDGRLDGKNSDISEAQNQNDGLNDGLNDRFTEMKEENIEMYALLTKLEKSLDELVSSLQQLRAKKAAIASSYRPAEVHKNHKELLEIQEGTAEETLFDESDKSDEDVEDNQRTMEPKFQSKDWMAQQQVFLAGEEQVLSNKILQNKLELSTIETMSLQRSLSNEIGMTRQQLSPAARQLILQEEASQDYAGQLISKIYNYGHPGSVNGLEETLFDESDKSDEDVEENQRTMEPKFQSKDWMAKQQVLLAGEEQVLSNKILQNKVELSMIETMSLQRSLYNYGHPGSVNGLDYPGGAQSPMRQTVVRPVPMHGQNCVAPTSHRGTHSMITLDSREKQWDKCSDLSAPVQAGHTTPSSQTTPRSIIDPPARTIPVNPRMKNIRELPFHKD